ncbi:hypothetical protein BDP27DRAFT_1425441 [Rhodocollybia butyracea]|uniref:Uncharacterized protein n=1 Tax=Rhodocollybia butyracea TaxID=206335 RepID=A0A9P5PMT1_9AGAR|nr:hypothetical protein BDP27DRAFT_1425441 [Rhodocollybia butyracea]
MSEDDIWKVLEPPQRYISLMEISTRMLKETQEPMVISIDARAREQAEHYLGSEKNQELRYLLILWMCKLRAKPVTAVFVFDGPEVPYRAHGPFAVPFADDLVQFFQQLIRSQGFYVHEATGDASVALWQLNKQVNAVMTEDVRVLVFGVISLFHIAKFFEDFDTVAFFSTEDLSQRNKRPVTPHSIFLLMILMGSDYASGIQVLTAELAYALANTALKTLLIFAAEDFAPLRLQEYLCTWKDALEDEIRHNTHEFLPSALPDLADIIQTLQDFPNLHAVTHLAQPTHTQPMPFPVWLVQPPNLANVANVCQEVFDGAPAQYIPEMLHHIWSAFIVGSLLNAECNRQACYDIRTSIRVTDVRIHTTTTIYRLNVHIGDTFCNRHVPERRIQFWVPAAIVDLILCSAIQDYQIDLVVNTRRPIEYLKAKLLLLPPLSTVGIIRLRHTLENETDLMNTEDNDILKVEK